MQIRSARFPDDEPAIWQLFEEAISGHDSFAFVRETPREELEKWWIGPAFHVFVAEIDGQIVGSYYLKPNQPGLGSHVANGGYMTAGAFRAQGIAKKMCAHSLESARQLGFRAIQFNLVVATNEPAVKAWQSMGFEIVGRLPGAFRHGELGYVDALVMFQTL